MSICVDPWIRLYVLPQCPRQCCPVAVSLVDLAMLGRLCCDFASTHTPEHFLTPGLQFQDSDISGERPRKIKCFALQFQRLAISCSLSSLLTAPQFVVLSLGHFSSESYVNFLPSRSVSLSTRGILIYNGSPFPHVQHKTTTWSFLFDAKTPLCLFSRFIIKPD